MDGGAFSHPVRRRKRAPLADRFAAWLAANFVIPAGQGAGEPFQLHDFQLEFLRAYLEQDEDGPRYRTCVFSTPRKQGKSTLLAAVALGHMCPDSPIFIPRFAGAVAAPTEKHSVMLAKAMQSLAEAAGLDDLKRRADPKPGLLLLGDAVLSLNTGTRSQGHGQDLDLAIVDEAGLLTLNQADVLEGFYDALSARNGRMIITGTRGDSPSYNDLIDRPDRRTFVCLHAADRDDDAADPATWAKANPGLGTLKPRRFMADAYAKAEKSGALASFKAWQLNMPLSPQREMLLDYDVLRKAYDEAAAPVPGEPCHVGLDLGGSASMTAAVIAYESGVLRVLGAFPSEPLSLLERGKRDLTGDLWHRCAQAGELIETSGAVTDLTEFFAELVQRIGPHPVRSISCDRYRQAELETALAKARLPWRPIFRGNGPKDGDADIRACRRLFLAGAVKLRRSILLEGSIAEADCKVSTTGAVQLNKSHANARIDAAQALVLACSALLRARDAVPAEYVVEVL